VDRIELPEERHQWLATANIIVELFSIKGWKYVEYVNNYQLLLKDSVSH
jgi:hypothetical protein